MPLFACEKCGAIDNTATSSYWWSKKKLCTECETGQWHNCFPKRFFNDKEWRKADFNNQFVEKI